MSVSERRLQVALKAEVIEMLELWARAQQPAHRIPEAIMMERFRRYFRQRFRAAAGLLVDSSDLLAEVLCELLSIVDGQDEISGVHPVSLAETLSRISSPLCRDAGDQ